MLDGLDALEADVRSGSFAPDAARRGRAHRARARARRAARRPRRQAARRSVPQRPGRDGPAAVPAGRRTPAGRGGRGSAGRAARPGGRPRRRSGAGVHPPPARAAGVVRTRARQARACPRRDVDRLRDWDERAAFSPLGRRRPRRFVVAARPARGRDRARLHRRRGQLDRRRVRPRLRRRVPVRLHDGGGAPVPPRRGGVPVGVARVRLGPARRRLRHRVVDHAAEEEPRRRRAGPWQGRPADRSPHRSPRDAEGPAVRVQPRPPGGQGAGVRRRRHARSCCCRR